MVILKNNTPFTSESKKGKIFESQHKDIQKKGRIDLVDLENDYLKHKDTKGNLFPIQIYPKDFQKIILEHHNKHGAFN
jgi:hypothetical protein